MAHKHSNTSVDKPARIHSLDGLRAVSILLVCVGHLAGTVNFPEFLLPLHNIGNFINFNSEVIL